MVDRPTYELDTLWNEFHAVVNLSSRELSDWLMTESSGLVSEPLPDQAGSELGRHVLAILGKRRTDLTDDDLRVMRKVVDLVTEERDVSAESESVESAGQTHQRHRLMSVGHDPLRPLRSEAGAYRR